MADEAVNEILARLKSKREAKEHKPNGPTIEVVSDNITRLPRPDGLDHTTAADFDVRSITWMWPGRFAIGKLGLIGGMPDMGKGLISAFIAAAVTASVDLPCGEGKTPQGHVLWFTAEDDIEDTVVPRLIAAGADLTRIHIVKTMRKDGKERTFNLVTDLPELRKTVERIGNVVLVIIDPMSAYVGVGKVNTSSTTDVRGFLTPLTQMAAELEIAVIGIMHFNKKADVTSAMLRIADSLAYVAAARHVYVVVEDPHVEGRRLFVKAKNNLAPDKAALPYVRGGSSIRCQPMSAWERSIRPRPRTCGGSNAAHTDGGRAGNRVIGIMHFNKKADVTSAMLRIADSLAYVAAARHVYVVVEDPHVEGRRLFVKAKNNLAPDKAALLMSSASIPRSATTRQLAPT